MLFGLSSSTQSSSVRPERLHGEDQGDHESRGIADEGEAHRSYDGDDPTNDTIFALSSGFTGEQATAVAVVRISGPDAHHILQDLLPPHAKLPRPRWAALKKLYHRGQILDHALVLRFDAPHSFTGEDVVELQCHGSRAIVHRLLTEVLPSFGRCRMAEPGEFTQRAYGRGKLDLVQVEALADVLGADTQAQVQQALHQLDGRVSRVYDEWRGQLISGLAHAEAVIDFGDDEHLGDDDADAGGDYGVTDETRDEALQRQQSDVWGDVTRRMLLLQRSMEAHLGDGRSRGEIIREGVKIAILGPPNAGKSSLFNLLARRDAAIVSPIAGTTRDVLQVSLDLGGVKCTLHDTAGVRGGTDDVLELEGMRRAKAAVDEADLVVAMVDSTEADRGLEVVRAALQEGGATAAAELDPNRLLLVLNKSDLARDGSVTSDVPPRRPGGNEGIEFGGGTFEISCLTQDGIDALLDALTRQVRSRTERNSDDGGEGALITRARHRQHVEAAVDALRRFAVLSSGGAMAVDMAAEELRLAASELGRVTGAVDVEDVLDVLFSDFCIGK